MVCKARRTEMTIHSHGNLRFRIYSNSLRKVLYEKFQFLGVRSRSGSDFMWPHKMTKFSMRTSEGPIMCVGGGGDLIY